MLLVMTLVTGGAVVSVAFLIVGYRVVCPLWIDTDAVRRVTEARRASLSEVA